MGKGTKGHVEVGGKPIHLLTHFAMLCKFLGNVLSAWFTSYIRTAVGSGEKLRKQWKSRAGLLV